MTTSILKQTFGVPLLHGPLRRQTPCNWLALGLLLAAWNAADDSHAAQPRPPNLRGYACVSVRAATRNTIAP
jgi:hypothetical protein